MTWFVGQRVVCIASKFTPRGALWFRLLHWMGRIRYPQLGKIYRVGDVYEVGGIEYLELQELGDAAVGSAAFRPLVDTHTDISIFERIRDRVSAGDIEEIADATPVAPERVSSRGGLS